MSGAETAACLLDITNRSPKFKPQLSWKKIFDA